MEMGILGCFGKSWLVFFGVFSWGFVFSFGGRFSWYFCFEMFVAPLVGYFWVFLFVLWGTFWYLLLFGASWFFGTLWGFGVWEIKTSKPLHWAVVSHWATRVLTWTELPAMAGTAHCPALPFISEASKPMACKVWPHLLSGKMDTDLRFKKQRTIYYITTWHTLLKIFEVMVTHFSAPAPVFPPGRAPLQQMIFPPGLSPCQAKEH